MPLFIRSVLLSRFVICIMSGIWWFWILLFVQWDQVVVLLFLTIIHDSWLLEQFGLLKHHLLCIVWRKLMVTSNEIIVHNSAVIYLFALSFLLVILKNISWSLVIYILVSVNWTVHEVFVFVVKYMMIFIVVHDGRF